MKKKKSKSPPKKWIVARSIYNNTDYEVWAICSSEEECKKYIATEVPLADQKDMFYFRKEN